MPNQDISAAYEPIPFRLPFPSDFQDEADGDILARANAMCGAAEAIVASCIASNQELPVTSPDEASQALAAFMDESGYAAAGITRTAVAMKLTALLQAYDHDVVLNAQQLRNFVTNKLLELAGPGHKEASQLRALEMIGKIRDVSLFDEKTTVVVEHMNTDAIKDKLRQRMGLIRTIVSQEPQDVEVHDVSLKESLETS